MNILLWIIGLVLAYLLVSIVVCFMAERSKRNTAKNIANLDKRIRNME